MLRSLLRVVVAAVVVLGLMLSMTPAAHARPLVDRTPAVQADGNWFEAALAWVTRLIAGDKPQPGSGAALQTTTAAGSLGSCIDPWGFRCP